MKKKHSHSWTYGFIKEGELERRDGEQGEKESRDHKPWVLVFIFVTLFPVYSNFSPSATSEHDLSLPNHCFSKNTMHIRRTGASMKTITAAQMLNVDVC